MQEKKIGLIVDINNPEALKLTNKVKDWLTKKNCLVSINPLTPSVLKNLDIMVTFGGDGTVLRAANAVASYNIPIARVDFGTTGYLCNIKADKVFQALKKILKGKFRLETQARIKAEILRDNKVTCSFDAFNEIVVGSTPRKKTAWLQLKITYYDADYKKEKSIEVTGDGLIIATKGGSTGYCLSADGPALLVDAFAVVASNGRWSGFLPSYARSFVAPLDARFEITVLRGGHNLPCVEADSDDDRIRMLKEEERVVITKSSRKNLFIEF